MSEAKAFDNGLTPEERETLFELDTKIADLKFLVERTLPKHRSYSLVVTKLDEAQHWLRDRQHRAP